MLVRSFANFAFIAAVVGGISAASAQELLAWRFTPGESLNYVVQQNMTMTMDVHKMDEAKQLIKDFRRNFTQLMEEGEKKEVYKLCISFFPLSHKDKKNE